MEPTTKGPTRLEVIRWISRQRRLALSRHPLYMRNRTAGLLMSALIIFWFAYLGYFGYVIGMGMAEEGTDTQRILGLMIPVILLVDFLTRFSLQKTPSVQMMPYLLLPVRREWLIDLLILDGMSSLFNFLWLCFFIPLGIGTVLPVYGLTGMVAFSLGLILLFITSGLWYQMASELMDRNILFWLLPIGVYGLLALWMFQGGAYSLDVLAGKLAASVCQGQPLAFLGLAAALALMALTDRTVLRSLSVKETRKEFSKTISLPDRFRFLDRLGLQGEYLKLELRLELRNRLPRERILRMLPIILVFSYMLLFRDDDVQMLQVFWIITNLTVMCGAVLMTVMQYEGNYMDGLMTWRGSVYHILRAKFIISTLLLLVPMLVMTPFMVKVPGMAITCLCMFLFTAGGVQCVLLEAAVLHDRTIPMNIKMSNTGSAGKSTEMLMSLATMILPVVIRLGLGYLVGDLASDLAMGAVGLVLFLTNRYWILRIAGRIQDRRYLAMEHYRASKESE